MDKPPKLTKGNEKRKISKPIQIFASVTEAVKALPYDWSKWSAKYEYVTWIQLINRIFPEPKAIGKETSSFNEVRQYCLTKIVHSLESLWGIASYDFCFIFSGVSQSTWRLVSDNQREKLPSSFVL